MLIKKGKLTYYYNITPNLLSKVYIDKDGSKHELKGHVVNELVKSLQTSADNPFDVSPIDVSFDISINSLINDALDAIKFIKLNDQNEELSARISNYLFEGFAGYWVNRLLRDEKYLSGVKLWQRILSIVYEWEINNKPISIHKGTLYYFLAENYLLARFQLSLSGDITNK